MEKEKFIKGLNTDADKKNQPKDTYRFALNAINVSNDGEIFTIENEQSVELAMFLEENEVVIGKIPITNNRIVLFSIIKNSNISKISIVDNENVEVLIRDEDGVLNFNIAYPIQGVYREVKSCGITIYWTDNYNTPRSLNIDKIDSYYDDNGKLDPTKIELVKTVNKYPVFKNIEVEEFGNLKSGSYNVAVQLLDKDYNPSEWLIVSDTVNIYLDSLDEDYRTISGSINSYKHGEELFKYSNTTKSIKVELDNLDDSYSYYRLAFIEATDGTGEVSSVKITSPISINNTIFSYTGDNAEATIPKEEIAYFNQIVEKAETIAEYQNSLILGGISYGNKNYCALQKFASKINVDAVVKQVPMNVMTKDGNKSPVVRVNGGMGFMPDEIYSFGIVYKFSDGTTSPVFHIPGRNPNIDKDYVFVNKDNVIPMSNNNTLKNIKYQKRNDGMTDYWGMDSVGEKLEDTNVRHHRFPSRNNIPLVEKVDAASLNLVSVRLRINYWGDDLQVGYREWYDRDGNLQSNGCTERPLIKVELTYNADGNTYTTDAFIDPANFDYLANMEACIVSIPEYYDRTVYPRYLYDMNPNKGVIFNNLIIRDINSFEIVSLKEITDSGEVQILEDTVTVSSYTNLNYRVEGLEESVVNDLEYIIVANTYGAIFSNIELPPKEVTNGKEVVGYYIVYNERTSDNKTVVDSGVLLPTTAYKDYISHSLLNPEDLTRDNRFWALINPEYKFRDKKYLGVNIKHKGTYKIVDSREGWFKYQDVLDGTSYDPDVYEGEDNDGWNLSVISRDYLMSFENAIEENYDVKNITYLSAVNFYWDSVVNKKIYNNSADNRVGIVEFETPLSVNGYPYVYLTRDVEDPYSDFMLSPYYQLHDNIQTEDIFETFNGDIYVSSIRYANTNFYANQIASREKKKSKGWLAGIIIVVGIIASFFSLGAGIAIIGAGITYLSSEIEKDKLIQAYTIDYRKGLQDTLKSVWVRRYYEEYEQEDDTIEWIGEVMTDLYFESQINIGLRTRVLNSQQAFLDSPGIFQSSTYSSPSLTLYVDTDYRGEYVVYDIGKDEEVLPDRTIDSYFFSKLLKVDNERTSGFSYYGHALGEAYFINEDYHRRNKEKIYFHLPITYDCYNKCPEKYPGRFIWSQQAFKEELTDNYKVFLVNNFKDLKYDIKNIYSLNNKLYIHTNKDLFIYPKKYQERIANDIITYIGSGEQFAIDPNIIYDVGVTSKNSFTYNKKENEILFVSENNKEIYLLKQGKLLKISDNGIKYEMYKRLKIEAKDRLLNYNLSNVPYFEYGNGFITEIDIQNNRYLITKKDLIPNTIVDNKDYLYYATDIDKFILFNDFEDIIYNEQQDGWIFKEIKDNKMLFSKEVTEPYQITVYKSNNTQEELPTDVILYITGVDSIDIVEETYTNLITDAKKYFETNFDINNSKLLIALSTSEYSERPMRVLDYIENNNLYFYDAYTYDRYYDSIKNNKIIYLFDRYSANKYSSLNYPTTTGYIEPTQEFIDDINGFINKYNLKTSQGHNIKLVLIPYYSNSTDLSKDITALNMQLYLKAMKSRVYTQNEVDNLQLPLLQWDNINTIVKQGLINGNDVTTEPLENYNVSIHTSAYISEFAIIRDFSDTSYEPTEIEVVMPNLADYEQALFYGYFTFDTEEESYNIDSYRYKYIYKEIEGDIVDIEFINNSFTISYSKYSNSFISYHSYLPVFYFRNNNILYSIENDSEIFRHNNIGKYGYIYGKDSQFILDYVSKNKDSRTVDWVNLRLYTEALSYDADKEEYYENRNITFDKIIIYTDNQSTGLKELTIKSESIKEDYMSSQVKRNINTIILDKKDKEFRLNNIRNYVVSNDKPIFKKNIESLQEEYFIDKVINEDAHDYNKSWNLIEKIRNKYLQVRLFFTKFKNKKLKVYFTSEQDYVQDEY